MRKPTKTRKKSGVKTKRKDKKIAETPDQNLDFQQDFGGLPERDLKKGLGCGG